MNQVGICVINETKHKKHFVEEPKQNNEKVQKPKSNQEKDKPKSLKFQLDEENYL